VPVVEQELPTLPEHLSSPPVYSGVRVFEDIKGAIRIRTSKKNRQRNGQKKKDKQRSTKHTHKTRDRVTQKYTITKMNENINLDSKIG
jgi:hypothetical protein